VVVIVRGKKDGHKEHKEKKEGRHSREKKDTELKERDKEKREKEKKELEYRKRASMCIPRPIEGIDDVVTKDSRRLSL